MADQIMNISKGRFVEFHFRVDNNDPTNAVLVMTLWRSASEADDTLNNYDDLAAIEAGANTEETDGSYARIVLDDTDLAAELPDDTANDFEVDIAVDQTWSTLSNGSNALDKLILNYDSDSTAGTDSNIIPVAHYDFSVTPNGGDVTAQLNIDGYGRAA